MKKILIISSGYPSNGGQASTAYNLSVLLSKNNFDVKIIFLKNSIAYGDIDPKSSGNSHKINYAILTKHSRTRKIIKYIISLKIFEKIGMTSLAKVIYKRIQKILITRDIYRFLKKNRFQPDLAITNTPILYENFNKLFEKTLIIIGSSIFFWDLDQFDYQTIKNNPKLLNTEKHKDKISALNQSSIIFNSQLTQDFFHMNGVKPSDESVQYFNIPPHIITKKTKFSDRKYDIGIIISDFKRAIKGVKKIETLFHYFPENNKISIGKNNSILKSHINNSTFDLMNQFKLAEYLSEIKLVVIPSLFDPSPSILSEAILNGCNVLCSKNIGWNEYINENCVISNYKDNNEWIEKITLLLNVKIENPKLLKIISNSKNEICKKIDNVMNKE